MCVCVWGGGGGGWGIVVEFILNGPGHMTKMSATSSPCMVLT